jgi:hypothetical protein
MLFLNGNTVQARPLLQSFDDDRLKVANEEPWHVIMPAINAFNFQVCFNPFIGNFICVGSGDGLFFMLPDAERGAFVTGFAKTQ